MKGTRKNFTPAKFIEETVPTTPIAEIEDVTPIVEQTIAEPLAAELPAPVIEPITPVIEPITPAIEPSEIVEPVSDQAPVPPRPILDQRVISLLYSVILGEFNQACLYLEAIVKDDPQFTKDPSILEALAHHIDMSFLITNNTLPTTGVVPGSNASNNTSARQNPSESVIGWFLEQKFAVGRAANTIIRRFFKIQVAQPIATTSTARCINVDKIVAYNSLFHSIVQKTRLEDIDESLFTELYEYAPIVLEKLINLGLDVGKLVANRPIAWHVMRVATHPTIIFSRNETHAMSLYKCLKNSGTYRPLPLYFEGCRDNDIITDLCTKPDFIEALKNPIRELEDRYLIQTISDDRITNILHMRGCPDPSKGIFDELILDRVAALNSAIARDKTDLHKRNAQDLNLLGFSLWRGPYTQAHLICLQRIAAELGPSGFNPQIDVGIEESRRVKWYALHIAFYRFDLAAWDRRCKLEEVEMQVKQGNIRPEQGTQQLSVIRENVTDMHNNRAGYQVQIIEWLYTLFPEHPSFGHDKHGRTPLMCLPINNDWIDEKKGLDRASPIIDHFVKQEVRCLSHILRKPINENSYRQRIISWRQSELKNRETAFTMRQMHAAGAIIDRIFSDLKPQTK